MSISTASSRAAQPMRGFGEVVVAAAAFSLFYIAYFSPALLQGRLLAPGDGLIQYVPALLSKLVIWNDDLYAGFPSFADPQALTWSPLRLLGNYNAAVIAVYALASTSAYALLRDLTGMRAAGVLGGLVYGSGGAMVAHLGHLTIIYSAAWIPLAAWASARAREADGWLAVPVGAVAVACPMLGGHPQIYVFGMLLVGLYALFCLLVAPAAARGTLVSRYAIIFGCGVAMASIQLIPLKQLGDFSLRQSMSFDEFVSYSLGPKELLTFFLPRVQGSYTGTPYFGTWGLTETATYAGVATLLLVIAALSARHREREAWFWAVAAIAAVLYALGKYTPLAQVAFHVPGLNQFRAPARTAFVTMLALAVLAGFGLRAIVEGRVRGVRLRRMWQRIVVVVGGVLFALVAAYPWFQQAATARGITLPPLLGNPQVMQGIATIVASMLVLAWLTWRPSRAAVGVLLVLVAVDLASFGWFAEWRGGGSSTSIAIDGAWQRFATQVRDEHGRVLFVDGGKSVEAPGVRPNLNVLYGLPSASGYGPLILRDYAATLGMDTTGAITSLQRLPMRLQLAGVEWLVGGDAAEQGVLLGGSCSPAAGTVESTLRLPAAMQVTHVEVVSHLVCSTDIADDEKVLDVELRAGAGTSVNTALRAGTDTAEWAIDRPDVASVVKHHRPSDSETFSAGDFNGRWFRTRIPVDPGGGPVDVDRVTLHWRLPASAATGIAIRSIALVDARTGKVHRMSGDDAIRGELEPRDERSLPGARLVSRVRVSRGLAWLVDRVVPLSSDAAIDAVHRGKLPDGTAFNPEAMALVDPASSALADGHAPRGDAPAKVGIGRWSAGEIELTTQSPTPAFLVVAESFYPGWRASIDGRPAEIVRANIAFQGVPVPAGTHTVSFRFVPTGLLLGSALAAGGFVIVTLYVVVMARASRRAARAPAPSPSSRLGT